MARGEASCTERRETGRPPATSNPVRPASIPSGRGCEMVPRLTAIEPCQSFSLPPPRPHENHHRFVGVAGG